MAKDFQFVVTVKSAAGPSSPWLVIGADDVQSLQQNLRAAESVGITADIGRLSALFQNGTALGSTLGATAIDPEPAQDNGQWGQGTGGGDPWGGQQQATPPASDNPWGSSAGPAAQPPQQGAWGGQQAPAPAPQADAAGQVGPPPMVLGQPAKHIGPKVGKNGKTWEAWADPRPKALTQHIQDRTDDPNDPGLASGAKVFWRFI